MLLIITVTIITVEARKFFVKIKQKIDFWTKEEALATEEEDEKLLENMNQNCTQFTVSS